MFKKISSFNLKHPYLLAIIASLGIWLFCFRGFISGKLAITQDAIAYFEHFNFFFDNISKGFYPLWDPTRSEGTPIEFFLRRIGSFNPLIFMMLLLHKTGFSYYISFLLFLSLYYWVGMLGFYHLCREIFEDRRAVFIGYLLMMFSSMGTRLFDSYINLTFIPMIWFFYFLVAFSKKPSSAKFLGMTFTLMVMLTTYIPFYFILIMMTFLAVYSLFYGPEALRITQRAGIFLSKRTGLWIFCLAMLVLSSLPGVLLFQQTDSGEIALPQRHYQSKESNVMAVDLSVVKKWGIEEDLLFSTIYLKDLQKFKFAVLYWPGFAMIVLLLGLMQGLTRRLIFLIFWGILLFILCSRHLPVYDFLYERISFFKYFRNLHFFLWFILSPIGILIVVEQIRSFLRWQVCSPQERRGQWIYISVVHALAALLLSWLGPQILTTWLTLVLSWIFFIIWYAGRLEGRPAWTAGFLLILVTMQPLEVYGYFQKNSDPYEKTGPGRYERDYLASPLQKELPERQHGHQQRAEKLARSFVFVASNEHKSYISVSSYDFLMRNLDQDAFSEYMFSKLLVYDSVEFMDDKAIDLQRLGRTFALSKNTAFVSQMEGIPEILRAPGRKIPSQMHIVTQRDPQVTLQKFNVNQIVINTDFSETRFLVYNDNYYPGWQASINGQPVKLYKTNVSFKGVVLPPGKNTVVFQFGEWWRRGLNIFLMIIFAGVFLLTLITNMMFDPPEMGQEFS